MSKFISSTNFIKFTNSTGVENVIELSVMDKRDKKSAWLFFVPFINSISYWKIYINKDHLTSRVLAILLTEDEGLKIWIKGRWSILRTNLLQIYLTAKLMDEW